MTPLEHLWNGWRAAYIHGLATPPPVAAGQVAPRPSVFTQILESSLADTDTHIVFRGESVFAILNAFPYSVGHLLVLPYRQVPDLDGLTDSESAELWSAVRAAVRAVEAALHPEGVNIGINLGRPAGGSISEHLHVHVVPRWVGDANFMTATANTRTLPEALPDTAARLRAAWPDRPAGEPG